MFWTSFLFNLLYLPYLTYILINVCPLYKSLFLSIHIYFRKYFHLQIAILKLTIHVLSNDCLVTPPAQRVQFILGEEVGDDAHESHPLFSEMEELVKDGDEMEWKETAR